MALENVFSRKTCTLNDALIWAAEIFRQYSFQDAYVEAELIIAHVLRINRINLYSEPERSIPDSELLKIRELIVRRLSHEPMAYILNNQPFMSLDFSVNRSVLIPRPETETLVECAINIARSLSQNLVTFADIGTGSGAIAVSLAKYLEKSFVFATDNSPDALKAAKTNAEKHKIMHKCKFLNGDMFSPLKEGNFKQRVDIVISNPPYVPTHEIQFLEADVKNFEPKDALDGGEDGLFHIKRLIREAPQYLKPQGYLMFEFGIGQRVQVQSLILAEQAYSEMRIENDLSGLERIAVARLF